MIRIRGKRRLSALWAMLLSPLAAFAASVPDLYEAAQPVTSSQEAAFAEALRTVVVKVSGQRNAPAQLGAALRNPRQFVQRFGVTADNVLQVGFDDVSIDRLLLDAGLPIWGRERPATLIVLNLDGHAEGWVSAEALPADRERMSRVARERGVPLRWEMLDPPDRNVLSAGPGAAGALTRLAARYGANAVLLGQGSRDGTIDWTLANADGAAQAAGGLEDGVHLAADTFARVFATAGSTLVHVTIEVVGVEDLNAYAATTNYLEAMTLVRSVSLEQVSGATMRFRLAVRGNAETLRRAIALDDTLVALDPSGGDPSGATGTDAARLAFRYRP